MPTRRRPKKGYDFLEKQKYRQKIWNIFSQQMTPESATIIMLPSKNGKEIDIAIENGFKEENIIAIDDDKAMLMWAPWRGKYPKIRIYADSILRASKKLQKDKVIIHAINLDLCGNLSARTFEQVSGFIKNITVYNNPIIAITMFKGREKHAVNCMAKIIVKKFKNDLKGISKRLGVLLLIVKDKVPKISNITQIAKGEYPNGVNTMDWGIFKLKMKLGENE